MQEIFTNLSKNIFESDYISKEKQINAHNVLKILKFLS